MTRNPVQIFVDLAFPQFNIDYSSPFSYLTDTIDIDHSPKLKLLDSEQEKYLKQIIICSSFENRIIHDLILRLKYGMEWSICESLVQLLIAGLHPIISELSPVKTIIASVPPDPKRLLYRGFHAPDILSQKLGEATQFQVHKLFQKNSSTPAQFHLSRKKRLTNLSGSFSLFSPLPINLSGFDTILLIDDVTTTGSTFTELAKVLKSDFPFLSIIGVAVAGN